MVDLSIGELVGEMVGDLMDELMGELMSELMEIGRGRQASFYIRRPASVNREFDPEGDDRRRRTVSHGRCADTQGVRSGSRGRGSARIILLDPAPRRRVEWEQYRCVPPLPSTS
jgi:hypothetical protein